MSWSVALGLAAAVIVLAAVGWLIWWLFFETEGVYLGPRIVVWLYDVYARRYDSIKRFEPEYEAERLAEPLLALLPTLPSAHAAAPGGPLVLDVATGTARLQIALHALPGARFHGTVVGLDASRQMLAVAAEKLRAAGIHPARLVQQRADGLPFADGTFDAVTCLEALEFFPDADRAIAECIRVLKPGGLLFLTNRKGTFWMPGRTPALRHTRARLAERFGLTGVSSTIWQVDYDQVWGYKPGSPAAASSGASSRSSVGETPQ